MRYLVLIALFAVGCGKQIGDACVVSSDCSPNGDRLCDPIAKEGYCTIQGCDYNTCPSEAACIQFFTGQFDNRTCTESTEDISTNDCSLDEKCDLQGRCVTRSSEVRYCMLKCDKDSDCRGGYECRDLQRMIDHGGEPVLSPGTPIDNSVPKFCASAPAS